MCPRDSFCIITLYADCVKAKLTFGACFFFNFRLLANSMLGCSCGKFCHLFQRKMPVQKCVCIFFGTVHLRNNQVPWDPNSYVTVSSWGIIFLYWELCFLSLLHRTVQFGHILRHKIQPLLQDAIWKGHQLLKVYVFR